MKISPNAQKFIDQGMRLNGNRVAIVMDERAETYGKSNIVKAEDYKTRPLMGTIVLCGDDIPEEKAHRFTVGKRVTFNRVGASIDQVSFGPTSMEVATMSTLDILFYWEE